MWMQAWAWRNMHTSDAAGIIFGFFGCRYSNPPLHGALLVSTILHDADLKEQWYKVNRHGCPALHAAPPATSQQLLACPWAVVCVSTFSHNTLLLFCVPQAT